MNHQADRQPTDPQEQADGQVLDAQLHLLDRQILDRDGKPVTTIDDVSITDLVPGGPAPVILDLLSGPVLSTRIFGGRPPESRWKKIPWKFVADVGTVVTLGIDGDTLDATWTERWVRDHIIARIPGGTHDPE